jgi:hypothetical protein
LSVGLYCKLVMDDWGDITYDELIQMTLPHPPNLSLPQPYTTRPIPICLRAEAHMTQGSTVTYRVIAERGAGFVGRR